MAGLQQQTNRGGQAEQACPPLGSREVLAELDFNASTGSGGVLGSRAEFLDFVAELEFNAIRLPLAVDNVLDDPLVGKWSLTANEQLRGLRSLALLERVVVMAAARGLLVLLDVHRLSARVWPTAHGLWYSNEVGIALSDGLSAPS